MVTIKDSLAEANPLISCVQLHPGNAGSDIALDMGLGICAATGEGACGGIADGLHPVPRRS